MSTTHYEGNRYEKVFGPEDVEDIRRRLERGRWWRFLNAKDKLLQALNKARRVMIGGFWKATEALRLDGIAVAASRLLRRAGEKAGPLRSTVKAGGIMPTLVWAATTVRGRRVITRTSRAVVLAAVSAVRTATRWAGKAARAFGPRGDRLATSTAGFTRRLSQQAAAKIDSVSAPLRLLWAIRGMAYQAAGAWGRQKALSGLLGHFLPGSWARVAKLLTTLLLVPGSVIQQLLGLVLPPKAAQFTRATTASGESAAAAPRARVVKPAPAAEPRPVVTEDVPVEEDFDWRKGEHLVTAVTHADVDLGSDSAGEARDAGSAPGQQHRPGHGTGQRRVRHLGDEDRVGTFGRYPAAKQGGKKRH